MTHYSHIKIGAPQTCPKCGGQNESGRKLPKECRWCGEFAVSYEIPKPITYGNPSRRMWDLINAVPDYKVWKALYSMGCRMQELEQLIREPKASGL